MESLLRSKDLLVDVNLIAPPIGGVADVDEAGVHVFDLLDHRSVLQQAYPIDG